MIDVWTLACIWIGLTLFLTFIYVHWGIFPLEMEGSMLIGLVDFLVPFFGCTAAYYICSNSCRITTQKHF